jgi:Zn-finger nucleic acid-binding protein
MCGAPTRSDATHCDHCGARLATVACPSCFGMIFEGSRFCPLCGARADRAAMESAGMPCPKCDIELQKITVGKAILCECSKCEGFWLDTLSFEEICTDREQQSALLGTAVILPPPPLPDKVHYIKCPQCRDLMQRVNFAGCSGVVIDTCRLHGAWFDAKELQRIIQFIRAGGMDRAREKQIAELQRTGRPPTAPATPGWAYPEPREHNAYDEIFDAVWAAASLLFHFLRR